MITSEKQKLFCKYYVWEGYNASKAALLAGYSKGTAYDTGWKLLKKPEIQAEIKRLIKIREKKLNISDKRIIEELAMAAFSDPRDYYDDEGNLLPIIELSERAAKALAEFTVTEGKNGRVIKIKRENKLKALETLARIHNMFYNDQDPNLGLHERVIYYPVKVQEGSPVDLTAKIEKPASKDN
ncbi:MAG: terminase small subunit [Candidatus Marinimicrobia bacterium]|nr:terminase small subunit [Candidatus Neomarinimicrobiota bacterium]MBL7047333.1 terminase small subunit [Candidatus Neomarinimicrobiota bacterium]